MLYKAEYGPNELLCPRTYNYVRLDEKVREFIDKKGKDPSLSDTNEGVNSKMVSVCIYI